MECPRCKASAVILELKDVEIDYCPKCGGIWLDAGELERLLGDNARKIYSTFQKERFSKEKKLRCPACHRKMNKVVLISTRIDICPKNHGIWFDKGELQKVITAGDINSDVLKFLKDMFNNEIKE
ncbi:MAG: zf-TFIIB domain-containing protein [Candidatus Cloacimonetes bacterium]|nr:zf-TFIIB domain-containing protein [Candidatus Cloacimonadota bacterium]